MSRTLGKWRWPLMAALGCGLSFLAVESLWGEGVGIPGDATWFQFFVVALGGGVMVLINRMREDSRSVKQALLGYGDDPGLIGQVRQAVKDIGALKEQMTESNGHRKSVNESVSRHDRELERLRNWAQEAAPKVGIPFLLGWDEVMRRERDAG